jgi:GMP synthase-like glutamine amidotransferase
VFDAPLYVYHWHHEGFDLPAGAELLAAGERFPHQAYRYGGWIAGSTVSWTTGCVLAWMTIH